MTTGLFINNVFAYSRAAIHLVLFCVRHELGTEGTQESKLLCGLQKKPTLLAMCGTNNTEYSQVRMWSLLQVNVVFGQEQL